MARPRRLGGCGVTSRDPTAPTRADQMTTLEEIGERRLVKEYLTPRYGEAVPNFGDDAAIFPPFERGVVVATTDPCPEPAATLIGDQRPELFGHLLATINLSDLAAVGAEPLGMLISLETPW